MPVSETSTARICRAFSGTKLTCLKTVEESRGVKTRPACWENWLSTVLICSRSDSMRSIFDGTDWAMIARSSPLSRGMVVRLST